MSKNVLITGGAGYIGSLLSDTLVNLNYNVTVVDNMYFKKNTIGHLIIKKNFKFIKDDARNKDLMNQLLRKNDIIIPLACLVGAPLCDKFPSEAKEVNQDSIIHLIKSKSKEDNLYRGRFLPRNSLPLFSSVISSTEIGCR